MLRSIGVARCFVVAGLTGCSVVDGTDPLGPARSLDDQRYALDHFELKLLKLPDMMRTAAGRSLAQQRAAFAADFRRRLAAELRGEA